MTRHSKQVRLIRCRFNLTGLGSETNCPKWVTKPLTLTRSFKGQVDLA